MIHKAIASFSMAAIALGLLASAAAVAPATAAERIRFWNLTLERITHLSLAPAGTTQWTGNQCDNDADKAVDPDERLVLTGVSPGRYDVKLKDDAGRSCLIHNVELTANPAYAFSLEEKDLTDCRRPSGGKPKKTPEKQAP